MEKGEVVYNIEIKLPGGKFQLSGKKKKKKFLEEKIMSPAGTIRSLN